MKVQVFVVSAEVHRLEIHEGLSLNSPLLQQAKLEKQLWWLTV